MKKKDLEIRLARVRPFEDPDPSLEQYPTPADIAADILFEAYAAGDVAGAAVADLGCGTGIFAIGASLLGAESATGYDASASALSVAEENAALLGADVKLVRCDVSEVSERADTVFMNPPFGCQTRRADRAFLEKAMEIAPSVYSMHMASTLPFVEEFAAARSRRVVSHRTYKYNIPHTFAFHSKARRTVDVVAVNIR